MGWYETLSLPRKPSASMLAAARRKPYQALQMDTALARILCVAVAGALGAVSRWGLSRLSHSFLGDAWPYGTLVVNIAGCFVFGVVFEALRDRLVADHHLRLLLLTGFAGAFTTYSTFAFDTYQLATDRHLLWAGLNIGLHVVLGIIAVVLGIAAGRWIV